MPIGASLSFLFVKVCVFAVVCVCVWCFICVWVCVCVCICAHVWIKQRQDGETERQLPKESWKGESE